MSALQVGDVGVVINSRGTRYEDVTVVKVGRKWATVEPSWHGRFDIANGLQDGGKYHSDATFYTPASLAHRDSMQRARERVTDAGLSFWVGKRWADDDVAALAAWLDERFGKDD